jgi:hypothetical protein
LSATKLGGYFTKLDEIHAALDSCPHIIKAADAAPRTGFWTPPLADRTTETGPGKQLSRLTQFSDGGIAMKSALTLVLFLAASAFAQDQAALTAAEATCGPKNVKFDATEDETHHPTPQPEPGKALVYVIQDMGLAQCNDCALTKVGLDGTWMGANQGSSYIFIPAETGERHLCVNWQSRLGWRSHAFGMANFTAEPGHVYYFHTRISVSRSIYDFDLDPVNSDEGKYLVASSAYSVSHPKK